MVVLDKQTYERVFKEVPTYKFISQSVLVDRLRLNGSLARVAIRELEEQGVIRRISRHASQVIYSKFWNISKYASNVFRSLMFDAYSFPLSFF